MVWSFSLCIDDRRLLFSSLRRVNRWRQEWRVQKENSFRIHFVVEACWEAICLFSPSLQTRARKSERAADQHRRTGCIFISPFVYLNELKHTGSNSPLDKNKLKQMTTHYMQIWEEFRSIFSCFDQSSSWFRSFFLSASPWRVFERACTAERMFLAALFVEVRF